MRTTRKYCYHIFLQMSLLLFPIVEASSKNSDGKRGFSDIIILRVENSEPDSNNALLLAIGNGEQLSHVWNEEIKTSVINHNPYVLYHKGNEVGSYRVTDIVEDEEGGHIVGITSLFEGINRSEFDSLGWYLFTAVSNNHRLKQLCKQPIGYKAENFGLDFDCNDRTDYIRTKVTATSATVDLMLDNGSVQRIDSVKQNGRIESIYILDVFDIDGDGNPEILATINTYPTYGYILYKQSRHNWGRVFESFGFGD